MSVSHKNNRKYFNYELVKLVVKIQSFWLKHSKKECFSKTNIYLGPTVNNNVKYRLCFQGILVINKRLRIENEIGI